MKSPQTPKTKTTKNTTPKNTRPVTKTKNAPKPEKTTREVVDSEITDAFIKEVDEEVHNDELKVFWNKYGLFVIIFVVLAVSAAVSFETIKDWRNKQFQTKTENFISAVQGAENPEVTIKVLENIVSDGNELYSEQAKIQIADVLMSQNKTNEAYAMMQSIVDDENASTKIRYWTAIKLASYKIGTAPRAEVEALLQPVINANIAWSPYAKDLLAMAAIDDGDLETAREIYTDLVQNPELSPAFKNRIQDMLSSLNDM